MKTETPHRNLFSSRSLLRGAILVSLIFQIFIVLYNHFNGFYVQQNIGQFLFSLVQGLVMSVVILFLMVYADTFILQWLNQHFKWRERGVGRVALLLTSSVVLSILISACFSAISYIINPDKVSFGALFVGNSQILAVINILILAVLEAYLYYEESRKAKWEMHMMQQQMVEIKFQTLKNQIEPHFLFNSLNVLSGLMTSDMPKAQIFVDELAKIYRYVLETIEKPLVPLSKELRFAESYLYLQKIRYGEGLTYTFSVKEENLCKEIPPLSLQLALENAMKHNIINEANPLLIEILDEDNAIKVCNQYQPKQQEKSTGKGQKNLVKRYQMISDDCPVFGIRDGKYISILPLLKCESNENTDN